MNVLNMWIRIALGAFLLVFISACGGGGGSQPGSVASINSKNPSPPTPGGGVDSATVKLKLLDSGGLETTVLSFNKPLTASATVRDALGAPLANTLVTFSSNPAFSVLSPAAGSVLTDAQGVARINMRPVSLSATGADVLKAVALVGNTSVDGLAPYNVGLADLTLKVVTPTSSPSLLKAYGSSVMTFDVLSNGARVSAEAVSITLGSACVSSGKATLPGSVTTIAGRAEVVYRDSGCAQTDAVTAVIAGTGASARIEFQTSSPDAAAINLVSVLPSDRNIVIKGAGGSGRTEIASIRFKVIDQFGNPLANQNVKFTVISTKAVVLNKSADTSDAQGEVFTTVSSGTEPTALRVQATLDNRLSSISDAIAVTTGLPIQSAFSVSAKSHNIEGFDYDNAQTDITVLLADQFGNPVADGTPVVFQTDSGAVGTADRGGCNTVNGSCNVAFRSQNPRYGVSTSSRRAGVATIKVSASDNTGIALSGSTKVFLSGSFATRINRIRDDGSLTPVLNSTIALTATNCLSQPVRLQINDSRNNPLPGGTTLAFGTVDNLEITEVFPSIVPDVVLQTTNGVEDVFQGSSHVVPIKPNSSLCVPNGTGVSTGALLLKIQSPNGNVTLLNITINFPS